MMSLTEIKTPDQLAAQDLSLLPAFAAQTLIGHGPDAHWLALNGRGQAVARLSLWWNQVPSLSAHKLGVIGHFAATEAAAAAKLLAKAGSELGARGCTLAVGPMDGNTWRRYRFITGRGTEPAFFLEPDNPDEWPHWFEAAGFAPLATYFSALNNDLTVLNAHMTRLQEFECSGIRLRPLRPDRFDEDLRRIYALSVASFQNNFLYTPIGEPEFLAQYAALREHVRPELVLFAETDGETVGFIFAVPDVLRLQRGAPVDTVIIKTMAVVPGRRSAGLGNLLLTCCQEAGMRLGYRRAIHALMHESNVSLNLSSHYAKEFRRYALFARKLEPRA